MVSNQGMEAPQLNHAMLRRVSAALAMSKRMSGRWRDLPKKKGYSAGRCIVLARIRVTGARSNSWRVGRNN